MNWKTSLDKYLTTPPDDGFDNWVEKTIELLQDDVFNKHEQWIVDSSECNEYLNDMFNKNWTPYRASQVLTRILKYKLV